MRLNKLDPKSKSVNIVISAHKSLATWSASKYSATPPQTPAIILFFLLL
jgi:hypothetical protein